MMLVALVVMKGVHYFGWGKKRWWSSVVVVVVATKRE
jgi:hypothetical protein